MTDVDSVQFCLDKFLSLSDGQPARLLWCDIETTGLSFETDVVLEAGFIVTDKWGDLVADPMQFYVHEEYERRWRAVQNMSQFVREIHTGSGLLADLEVNPTYDGDYIANKVLRVLNSLGNPKGIILAGSTVGFDRGFIQRIMPALTSDIHYRNRDVSTFKEACIDFNPRVYAAMMSEVVAAKKHRVLDDLADSIREYQFYVREFLMVPGDED